jgi:hypothetical protein
MASSTELRENCSAGSEVNRGGGYRKPKRMATSGVYFIHFRMTSRPTEICREIMFASCVATLNKLRTLHSIGWNMNISKSWIGMNFWRNLDVAYFKVISQHLPGRTDYSNRKQTWPMAPYMRCQQEIYNTHYVRNHRPHIHQKDVLN